MTPKVLERFSERRQNLTTIDSFLICKTLKNVIKAKSTKQKQKTKSHKVYSLRCSLSSNSKEGWADQLMSTDKRDKSTFYQRLQFRDGVSEDSSLPRLPSAWPTVLGAFEGSPPIPLKSQCLKVCKRIRNRKYQRSFLHLLLLLLFSSSSSSSKSKTGNVSDVPNITLFGSWGWMQSPYFQN